MLRSCLCSLPPVPQGAYLASEEQQLKRVCLIPIVVFEEGSTSTQWTDGHPFRSRYTDPFSSVEQFNLTTGPALQTIGNPSLCFCGVINNGSHRLFHSATVSLEAQNLSKLGGAGQVTSGTLQSQRFPSPYLLEASAKRVCDNIISVHCFRLLQRFVSVQHDSPVFFRMPRRWLVTTHCGEQSGACKCVEVAACPWCWPFRQRVRWILCHVGSL